MGKNRKKVIAACADTMFPPRGPVPVSGTKAGAVAYVEAYMQAMSFGRRTLIALMFLLIQLSPWILGPRRTFFTCLTHGDRRNALAAMAKSRIYFFHAAFLSMRAILTMAYFASQGVSDRIMRTAANQEGDEQ